ncbi:MAG: SMP-30/gluconolactonase/LRE family protein, partial [Actinomycetota bacterium]
LPARQGGETVLPGQPIHQIQKGVPVRLAITLVVLVFTAILPLSAGAEETTCQGWDMRVIAEGLDRIENLEPDGRGGMLISAGPRNAIERVTPDGQVTTAFADVPGPGGLRVHGSTLYAVTNGSAVDGARNSANGKVETFDLMTGERTVYSEGLVAPNGLAIEPDGDAYVSRDFGALDPADPWVPNPFSGGIGTGMHITRIPVADPMHPNTTWAKLPDTNGLDIDKSNEWLYAATTFNFNAEVYRVALDDPSVIEKVADLGGITDPLNGLDDMTFGNDGNLYITANGMGRVWQLDPDTGDRCLVASGLQNPTAAKFGRGPGWPSHNLYVTGWDGKLRELVPPT